MALALRFDVSRGKGSRYFKSAFLGYTVGLVLTIIVMNWFQAAQVIIACFFSFGFPPQMSMCLGIIVPSVIDNCFLLDIQGELVEDE